MKIKIFLFILNFAMIPIAAVINTRFVTHKIKKNNNNIEWINKDLSLLSKIGNGDEGEKTSLLNDKREKSVLFIHTMQKLFTTFGSSDDHFSNKHIEYFFNSEDILHDSNTQTCCAVLPFNENRLFLRRMFNKELEKELNGKKLSALEESEKETLTLTIASQLYNSEKNSCKVAYNSAILDMRERNEYGKIKMSTCLYQIPSQFLWCIVGWASCLCCNN